MPRRAAEVAQPGGVEVVVAQPDVLAGGDVLGFRDRSRPPASISATSRPARRQARGRGVIPAGPAPITQTSKLGEGGARSGASTSMSMAERRRSGLAAPSRHGKPRGDAPASTVAGPAGPHGATGEAARTAPAPVGGQTAPRSSWAHCTPTCLTRQDAGRAPQGVRRAAVRPAPARSRRASASIWSVSRRCLSSFSRVKGAASNISRVSPMRSKTARSWRAPRSAVQAVSELGHVLADLGEGDAVAAGVAAAVADGQRAAGEGRGDDLGDLADAVVLAVGADVEGLAGDRLASAPSARRASPRRCPRYG